MRPTSFASLAAAILLAVAAPAHAVRVVDTGNPNGSAVGAYALDATDFVAGQVSFGSGLSINAISFHVLGGTPGETFTIALYSDNATHLPGSVLYSGTAVLGADGWNGLSNLTGWTLTAGSYWVAAEVGPGDSAGSGSLTGTLLDGGVPHALARTAFDAGSGYLAAALGFGLQVDATVVPVPEPDTYAILIAGLGVIAALRRRRRR
jgi:hypothetical protein